MTRDDIAAELRAVLRGMARSVVVVTARSGGERYAMTATAVCEVSMDPPSMLFCVNRDATMFPVLDDGADLTLNVLGHPHGDVSQACGGGRRGADRFAVGDWDAHDGPHPPALRDAAAVIRLRQASHLDHGTHRIIVGDVIEVVRPAGIDPLVYVGGRYVALDDTRD
ncbi:MAG: flavin reductase family protein [Janthinobacterium lividum]